VRVPDKPLPGDLVIRCREDRGAIRTVDVWVVTYWPDADTTVAGPYQSYSYAFQQSRRLIKDPSVWIWRDHAAPGAPEQLEWVGGAVA
jgi:hypothetical protein